MVTLSKFGALKPRHHLTFGGLLLGLVISGCGSDLVSTANGGRLLPEMKDDADFYYTMNGRTFHRSGSSVPATAYATRSNSSENWLGISLTESNQAGQPHVRISMGGSFSGDGTGRYSVDSESQISANLAVDSKWIVAKSGSVSITSIDTELNLVSGAFEFVCQQVGDSGDIFDTVSGAFNQVGIIYGSFGQGAISATFNDTANIFLSIKQETAMAFLNTTEDSVTIEAFVRSEFLQNGERYQILLRVPSIAVGYYAITASNLFASALFRYYTLNKADTGTLWITKVDNRTRRFSGSFEFKGMDEAETVRISHGVIDNLQWFKM
jgi:hypothetical protein